MNNDETIYSEEDMKRFFEAQKAGSVKGTSMKYLYYQIHVGKLDIPKQVKAVAILALNVACANEIIAILGGENTKAIETEISSVNINMTCDIDEDKLREIIAKSVKDFDIAKANFEVGGTFGENKKPFWEGK